MHQPIHKTVILNLSLYSKKRIAHLVLRAASDELAKVPEPCAICGDTQYPQAHHPDYDQPYLIQWLCMACHVRTHKGDPTKRQLTSSRLSQIKRAAAGRCFRCKNVNDTPHRTYCTECGKKIRARRYSILGLTHDEIIARNRARRVAEGKPV